MSLQTVPEKVGDTLRGLNAAAFAIGLEDHRRMLADAAQRTRDGHKAMMKAAMGDPTPTVGEQDVGDILVTGDITYSMSSPAGSAQPAAAKSSPLSTAAKAAIIGTALLGGGGLGAAATAYMMRPKAAPVSTESDKYGFDLLPPENEGR